MSKSVSVTEKIVEENEESEIMKNILLGSTRARPLALEKCATISPRVDAFCQLEELTHNSAYYLLQNLNSIKLHSKIH